MLFSRVLELDSDSGLRGKHIVDLRMNSQPDIHPTATPSLCRSIYHNPFSVITDILFLEVMIGLDWIHYPCVLQIRVELKKILPEVLGGLEVLQIPHHVL